MKIEEVRQSEKFRKRANHFAPFYFASTFPRRREVENSNSPPHHRRPRSSFFISVSVSFHCASSLVTPTTIPYPTQLELEKLSKHEENKTHTHTYTHARTSNDRRRRRRSCIPPRSYRVYSRMFYAIPRT